MASKAAPHPDRAKTLSTKAANKPKKRKNRRGVVVVGQFRLSSILKSHS
jgi:hypothetical protein